MLFVMKNKLLLAVFFFSFFLISCTAVKELTLEEKFLIKKTEFTENIDSFKEANKISRAAKILSVNSDEQKKEIKIFFSRELSFLPFRQENVEKIYSDVKQIFGNEFSDYNFIVYSTRYPIEELIPNYYRSEEKIDKNRLPKQNPSERIPIVKNLSKEYKAVNGLENQNVLLWHSHGWYYNNKEKRWMWQRARLFQSVEDIGPITFTVPFLIPMLENAGANVFVPRERDTQINEVIVDNDFNKSGSFVEVVQSKNNEWKNYKTGFSMKDEILKEGENPFSTGTSRIIETDKQETARVEWIPEIPEKGEYAVYISYFSFENSADDAIYIVNHSGGKTEFAVNQKIGGGTWIYLGKFLFDKGLNNEQGVILSNKSKTNGTVVSADAVKFGGGIGLVEREGLVSKRPKFVEGARYWLQYAGMPDTLVYNLNNGSNDYNDDYQSRAEYGNYLYGNPFGPNRKRDEKGLGIPIDVSLSFHTDAGITRNDTVVGTLMIYSTPSVDSLFEFPDGVSRLSNRDLADIVQTQIVEDIRLHYDSVWTRRQLMDAMYSEASRPNFPSMLLELLSHQNFLDMKFHLDPRYKFDVSRSIYKGMLKFLSYQYGYDYVVQPLPVTHFAAELKDNKVHLSWLPREDPLESTATAENYILYTRIDDNGFDNGIVINNTNYVIEDIEPGKIYSFKVAALNNGGESFPSEILSVGIANDNLEPLLIVNGFDRISAPASIETDSFSGLLNFLDEGVPYNYDLGFTGIQFNYDPNSKWETDDNPGHGASASDYETKVIAGNTFDFSYIHGKALMKNGFSFCSVSDESVWDDIVDLTDYKFVDIIFGEEKKTLPPKLNNIKRIEFEVFPEKLKQKVKDYLSNGGKMFLSGAYIGSDLYNEKDSVGIRFANDVLKIKLKTNHAVRTGRFYSTKNEFLSLNLLFAFNTDFNDKIYKVEAPDELGPVDDSEILLRYSENEFSAAVGYKGDYGIVTFGFPFETIIDEKDRNEIMNSILKYLGIK